MEKMDQNKKITQHLHVTHNTYIKINAQIAHFKTN